jgi:hypothetical protein
MSNLVKRKISDRKKHPPYGKRQLKGRSFGLILVILAWSLAMGWLLSFATSAQGANPVSTIGTVDVVPTKYQLGEELYLENCSTCHIALPPAVFPTETWKNLLQDSQHYGAQLKPLVDPPRLLVWRYLSTFSRTQLKDEETPYRLKDSRYFKALHPGVKLSRPVQLGSCVSCHIDASKYNFRRLTPEWQ